MNLAWWIDLVFDGHQWPIGNQLTKGLAIKKLRNVFAVFAALVVGTSAALVSGTPAFAADTCYSHTKNYTLSGGFSGQITFKLCAAAQFVKTFSTTFTTKDAHAHYGILVAADNQSHGYTSARARFDPNAGLSAGWDVNLNWYNGWRACGNFRWDGADPGPPGFACIKLTGGKFVND